MISKDNAILLYDAIKSLINLVSQEVVFSWTATHDIYTGSLFARVTDWAVSEKLEDMRTILYALSGKSWMSSQKKRPLFSGLSCDSFHEDLS